MPRLSFIRLTACISAIALAATASAAPIFVDAFPSDDSTVVASVGVIDPGEFGYFWSVARGDIIEESYGGTGLNAVVGLDLDLEITRNVLNSGASVMWDVLINDISVGSWAWSDGDGTGSLPLSFMFPAIAGAGSYTLRMEVINEVPPGQGSIAIGFPGDMTLTGVPEPSTLLLLFGGLLGLGHARRQRRAQ